jgi:MYXO-CTERM domain-containing protein
MPRIASFALACFTLAALTPRSAWAQECRAPGTPPGDGCLCNPDPDDGTLECIPVEGSSLEELFASDHPPAAGIDVRTGGNTTPETFVPGCDITFEFMLRAAGFNNVFGWYNVTGQKPADSLDELFPILDANIHCGDVDNGSHCSGEAHDSFTGNGHVETVSIAEDPRYLGGEIAFFLKTPRADGDGGGPNDCPDSDAEVGRDCGFLYFSERRWNDDVNPGGDPSYVPTDDDYIHLLTYNSLVAPGFYFAWEDLFEGGDNDFADVVTYVSNIVCSGAGGACQVPDEQGLCARGTLQCRSGVLECVAQHEPRQEECNGLDDDCNGLIDDGDDLCAPSEICRFGQCIGRCTGGEIDCPLGRTCVDGVCVENDCVGISCDPGQRCIGGECVDGCTDVVCPAGQVCDPFVGACVNPCTGVDCDGAQVCVDGVCQPHCECHLQRCDADGLSCGVDGHCYDPACENVTCDEGFICEGGDCIDACGGVRCPAGQLCWRGNCVPDDGSGGGPDGGFPGDGGDGSGGIGTDSGCGCSVPGVAAGGLPGGLALLLLGGIALWRRRPR